MKYKVEDLAGVLLDRAVAQVEGRDAVDHHGVCSCWVEALGERLPFRPSSDWEKGGPIIERESIAIIAGCEAQPGHGCWTATMPGPDLYYNATPGGTVEVVAYAGPLVAAMRAYVIDKLGAEVEL